MTIFIPIKLIGSKILYKVFTVFVTVMLTRVLPKSIIVSTVYCRLLENLPYPFWGYVCIIRTQLL